MGWKQSTIFIKVDNTKSVEDVSQLLGLDQYEKCEAEPFEAVVNPSGRCYIGYLGEMLVISHPNWPVEITAGNEGVIDKLISMFPKSRILVLGLHSVVNHYLYVLYENGNLIRKKFGHSDDPVVEDIGELLPTEKAFIKKRIDRIEDGAFGKEYFFKDDVEYGYSEDAVGENFVSCVLKEVWDYELMDMPDEYFLESELQGFILSSKEANKDPNSSETLIKEQDKSWTYQPNWKRHIWTVAILFIAIFIHRLFGC